MTPNAAILGLTAFSLGAALAYLVGRLLPPAWVFALWALFAAGGVILYALARATPGPDGVGYAVILFVAVLPAFVGAIIGGRVGIGRRARARASE